MSEDRPVLSRPPSNLVAVGIITVGLLICALVLSRSFVRVRSSEEIIRVIGSARKPIRSDLAIWTGSVTRDSANIGQAYAAVQADAAKVQAYLIKSGIGKSEIVPLSVTATTLYAQQKIGGGGMPPNYGAYDSESAGTYRKAVGYQLSQVIEVKSSNVDLVDRISRQSTEIISQGIHFESQTPLFLYTKLSELKVTMQADAARDARARAEQIAESSGCRIGKLRFARMNVPQITPLYSSQESDGGVDDTSSLDKRITAIVVAGYSIR